MILFRLNVPLIALNMLSRIKYASAEGEGNQMFIKLYTQALENQWGCPSPSQLADFIRNGDSVKPFGLFVKGHVRSVSM